MTRQQRMWLVAAGAAAAAGVGGVVVADVAVRARRGRGRGVRVQRTRSSSWSGGLGWLRVSRGGDTRHLPQACTSVDRLVDYLLDRAVGKLPEAFRARFVEEWQDHREHYSGWRLVWWALCVRATAMRVVAALGPARLPRDS
ncbi:MAG: hypothetical protein ACRDRU_19260 [Pseudonocardiaceae bacterium]